MLAQAKSSIKQNDKYFADLVRYENNQNTCMTFWDTLSYARQYVPCWSAKKCFLAYHSPSLRDRIVSLHAPRYRSASLDKYNTLPQATSKKTGLKIICTIVISGPGQLNPE